MAVCSTTTPRPRPRQTTTDEPDNPIQDYEECIKRNLEDRHWQQTADIYAKDFYAVPQIHLSKVTLNAAVTGFSEETDKSFVANIKASVRASFYEPGKGKVPVYWPNQDFQAGINLDYDSHSGRFDGDLQFTEIDTQNRNFIGLPPKYNNEKVKLAAQNAIWQRFADLVKDAVGDCTRDMSP